MIKSITKRKFQEMLNLWDKDTRGNEHGLIVSGHRNNQYHQKTRLYGDYLRSQDPDMFNAIYSEYLNGTRPQFKKYE